ncbi:MAG: cytochrome c family protein [Holophagae bacterium]|nr:MAG: cytochrome c family protein [Holophagae bacterium]
MRHLLVAVAVCCLAFAGCSREPQPGAQVEGIVPANEWHEVQPTDMTATQKAQQDLVATATNAMMAELVGELHAALDSGGAAAGIEACRLKAPEIAARVSEQYGVKIGRTSHRLRNPNNTIPSWAERSVADRVGEPSFLAGSGGEFAALLPIRLRAECEMCHGPVDSISEDVQRAIATFYPNDQAVGFVAGDVRGWIWVEVPPGEPNTEL